MKRTRTPIPPIFQGPGGRSQWSWTATMQINSSGYVHRMHVEARRPVSDEYGMIGTASGDVPPFVDVHEVLELLATEAMLVAAEPNLFGLPSHRNVDVSSQF